MSFRATTKNGKQFTWDLPGPRPKRPPLETMTDPVVYLYADSDELVFINSYFKNLPSTANYCVWKGYLAEFVFDNL